MSFIFILQIGIATYLIASLILAIFMNAYYHGQERHYKPRQVFLSTGLYVAMVIILSIGGMFNPIGTVSIWILHLIHFFGLVLITYYIGHPEKNKPVIRKIGSTLIITAIVIFLQWSAGMYWPIIELLRLI